jgi:hypothetical protein
VKEGSEKKGGNREKKGREMRTHTINSSSLTPNTHPQRHHKSLVHAHAYPKQN